MDAVEMADAVKSMTAILTRVLKEVANAERT